MCAIFSVTAGSPNSSARPDNSWTCRFGLSTGVSSRIITLALVLPPNSHPSGMQAIAVSGSARPGIRAWGMAKPGATIVGKSASRLSTSLRTKSLSRPGKCCSKVEINFPRTTFPSGSWIPHRILFCWRKLQKMFCCFFIHHSFFAFE